MEGVWRGAGAPDTAQQLRAAIRELLQLRQFGRATTLLEACRIEEKGDIKSLWYEVHYMKLKEQLGKNSLTAVQRFRCRKRNPPPRSLCPEEMKTRSLPLEARQYLRAWAEGNTVTPSVAEREQLIKETGLDKQQIYNWFANYRRRQKRVSSQRECDGEFRHRLIHHRGSTRVRSTECPQMVTRGSTRLPSSSDDMAVDVPCIFKEEQILDQQIRGTDYTAAQRQTLCSPQCSCLGLPCHQLLLPEMDPVALLNATASSYWYRSPDPPNTAAQTNMTLCPCLSMAADLACSCPVMGSSQPAYPNGLLQPTLLGSKFERESNLEQYCLSEELLTQDGLSLSSNAEMWQVPMPAFPNNASQFLSFNNSLLTNRQQSNTGVHLKEETVTDGCLQRSLLMCPVIAGYSVHDASWTQPEGSISDDKDRGWLKVSPSNASCYLDNDRTADTPMGLVAPVLDGGNITPGTGYSGVDPEESAAEDEQMLCAVAVYTAETCRGIEREGLNQPPQWTLGAVSVDTSPQSILEHVEIDCRRLTHLKVEAEESCNPEHSQVQQDSKLDIAAQALIQLSQRPAGDPSG